MPSSTIQPNVPGLDKALAAGQRLTASKGVFAATIATGATIAALNDPFGSGSTFSTVGTVPAQLALSGGNVVKGSGAAVVGAEYNIRVMATSADGLRETSAILTFGAVLEFGGIPVTPGAGGGVFSVPGLPNWSAAVQTWMNGGRAPKVLGWGNSTTAGVSQLNRRNTAWPAEMATLFNSKSLRADASSVFAANGFATIAEYIAYNPELSFSGTTGWTVGDQNLGGPAFLGQTIGERMIWAPPLPVDTFEITTADINTGSNVSVFLDGSATPLETFSTTFATRRLTKHSYTVPRGIHTIEVARATGGGGLCVIAAIEGYDSTQKGIRIINAGHGQATVATISSTSTPISPGNAVVFHGFDLAFIHGPLNDLVPNTAQATMEANLTSMVTKARAAAADAVLVFENSRGNANEPAFLTYFQNVAAATGAPLINIQDTFGTLAQANAAGLMSGDNLHPSSTPLGLGYKTWAKVLYNRVVPAAYQVA